MGNIKKLKNKKGEVILPVTGENAVVIKDDQGRFVGLKNYVNNKGFNKVPLDPTKVVTAIDKSDTGIIQKLSDPTTGAQNYPVTVDEAVFVDDGGDDRIPMKEYVEKQVTYNGGYIVITEDDVEVEQENTKGTYPYYTSFYYTNITITNPKIRPILGAVYSFIGSDTLTVHQNYRNARVKFGTNDVWHPVMSYSNNITSGSSTITKNTTAMFVYKNTMIPEGAFHLPRDFDTQYEYLINTVVQEAIKIHNNGYGAKYTLLFNTNALSDFEDIYTSIFTASSDKSTKKTVNINKLYLDRLPLYNGNTNYAEGTSATNITYQKYAPIDVRYNSNTNNSYVTLGKRAFMYLHNFDPDDMSFKPDNTIGNIFTIDNIEKRFPKTEEGEVYLWFLGWSGYKTGSTWYQITPNFSQLHTIYIYTPSTGELRNTNILVG